MNQPVEDEALIERSQLNSAKGLNQRPVYRWLLLIIGVIILLSPLPYWLTGIGQAAAGLSAEVTRQPDGTLLNSPKAEALHRLSLPMRLERLLLYPLLLLSFQLSGGSLALRRRLEERVQAVRFKWLPQRVRRWSGVRLWLRLRPRLSEADLLVMLLFILAFKLALALLYLPFNFYSGFILTHQFGLSTQTGPGWVNDWLKGFLLGLGIDGLSWTGFYALLRLLPRYWPIPAGALLMLFSAVFVLLTPILITPLFYEVRPLTDLDLRARILALTDQAGLHVEAVDVIDASSKTTQVNAYVTGFGGGQRIVLYDTLLAGYSPDQVEVVLAHELGHWYYEHVLLGWLGMGAVGWLGMFGLRWLLQWTWPWLGLKSPADIAGMPYILLLLFVASLLSLPIENGISRYAERQADQFALTTSQKPAVFIELFEQFAEQNLSLVNPPPWEVFIFYTHPPVAERIRLAEMFQAQ